MKLLIVLSVAALCVATPTPGGGEVFVDKIDGAVRIIGPTGNEIDIYNSVFEPNNFVKLLFRRPNKPVKKILVDENNYVQDADLSILDIRFLNVTDDLKTQAELFVEIYKEYQHYVDQLTYTVLSTRIDAIAKARIFDHRLLEMLAHFNLKNLNIKELMDDNIVQYADLNELVKANGLNNIDQVNKFEQDIRNLEILSPAQRFEDIVGEVLHLGTYRQVPAGSQGYISQPWGVPKDQGIPKDKPVSPKEN